MTNRGFLIKRLTARFFKNMKFSTDLIKIKKKFVIFLQREVDFKTSVHLDNLNTGLTVHVFYYGENDEGKNRHRESTISVIWSINI